jgi:uncharacterized protein YcfJ
MTSNTNKLCCILALAAGFSVPVYADTYASTATVVGSKPHYSQAKQQICEPIVVQDRDTGSNGTGGAIVGGLLGGVLGHQVGGGSGQTAATIVGAVGGAMLGQNVAAANSTNGSHTEERCRYESIMVQDGYMVSLDTGGYIMQKFYASNVPLPTPGQKVPITVTVQ